MQFTKSLPSWTLSYESFNPAEEGLREALCSLGNGYMGIRGSQCELLDKKLSYPAMYLAGLYNKLGTNIAGRMVYNEDLVNCPQWTFFSFQIDDSGWFDPTKCRILFFKQELDIRSGVLYRRMRVQDKAGRRTLIKTAIFISMSDYHRGFLVYQLIPENYSAWINIRTMLDGSILNLGVERYKQLNNKHLIPHAIGSFSHNGSYLAMKTSQSKVEIALASRLRIFHFDKQKETELFPKIKPLMKNNNRITRECKTFMKEGQTYTYEKTVAVYTSRDTITPNALNAAIENLQKKTRVGKELSSHKAALESIWNRYELVIEGDPWAQKILRLHMFHLLQTASSYNKNIDAGFPARGLTGEAYRGHIFWDEMYAMFFYDLHMPDTAKALLNYRIKRVNIARRLAAECGYKGAMYPWQSGSKGVEETQELHLNPLSGEWGEDHSHLQRHVSFAIAYNIWQNWQRTLDENFIKEGGAEVFLSIAQFCESLATYDSKTDRYHTHGIMGPDEFHEKMPHSKKPGLKDNAYSNFMIAWISLKAIELYKYLPPKIKQKLEKKLKIDQTLLDSWEHISKRMTLNIDKNGVIEQFEGYFKLKELDWEGYKNEYGNIHRMDRILKAEGKSPDAYKVSKQADTLMLFYLFTEKELKTIFKNLGYTYSKTLMRKNYDYYVARTSHGSTLSKVVHCYVAQRLNKPLTAWRWYDDVLASDIHDIQGGTTPEGIHCGVMGGSIDIVMRGFAGLSFDGDEIIIEPALPNHWDKIKLRFKYRETWISLSVSNKNLRILAYKPMATNKGITIAVKGKKYLIVYGKRKRISLH